MPKGIESTRHSLDFLQKLALAAIFGRFFSEETQPNPCSGNVRPADNPAKRIQ